MGRSTARWAFPNANLWLFRKPGALSWLYKPQERNWCFFWELSVFLVDGLVVLG